MMLYIILLGVLATATSQAVCPSGCSCTSANVTCSGLSYMPSDLPRNSSRVFFQNMMITDIPPYSFASFSQLNYIGFVNVSIYSIASFAFSGLNNSEIAFENVRIDIFNSSAISRMDTLRRLDFSMVYIGYWASDAISHIVELSTVNFIRSAVGFLDPPLMSSIGHLGFLSMSYIDIPELPSKSFARLNVVDLIYVFKARIGEIRPSALWNITYMDNFIFYQSEIGIINEKVFSRVGEIGLVNFQEVYIKTFRSGAISDVDRLHNIGIVDSKIDLMENFAISDLENTSSILVLNSQIQVLKSFAFDDVTTKIFQFMGNHVNRLECGTFEKLKDTVSDDFQFVNNTVDCDDNICWVFHPNRTYYLDAVFKDVQCARMEYPRLGTFSKTPFMDLPFGCSKVNYTAEFICNRSINTKSYSALLVIAVSAVMMLGLLN